MVFLKEMHFSFHFLGLKIICLENFHKSFLVNDCSESQPGDAGLHSRDLAELCPDCPQTTHNREKQSFLSLALCLLFFWGLISSVTRLLLICSEEMQLTRSDLIYQFILKRSFYSISNK